MRSSRRHLPFVAAAMFLLLFTAADLAYPPMCSEKGIEGSAVLSSSIGATSLTAAGAAATNTTPTHADDCFCCCGHVLAGATFHVAMPGEITQGRFFLMAQRVTVPPTPAFRPPRRG